MSQHRPRSSPAFIVGEPDEVYCAFDGDDWPCAAYVSERADSDASDLVAQRGYRPESAE